MHILFFNNDVFLEAQLKSSDKENIPSLEVVGAYTVELYREDNEKNITSRLGGAWNLLSPSVNDFIEQIEIKFRRKSKEHSYLAELNIPTSIPTYLNNYISENYEFKSLVKKLTSKLVLEANAIGGSIVEANVVFIHYYMPGWKGDDEDKGRILVVMVDKKGGFNFDEVTLEPKPQQLIDTDALRQAALYNLTVFNSDYPNNEGSAYLHFIEGKSKSDFFKNALGYQGTVDNNKSVENTFEALEKFMMSHAYPRSIKDKLRTGLEQLLEKKRKSEDKSVTLNNIQDVIDSILTASELEKGKGNFEEYVNEGEFEVNHTFESTWQSERKASSIEIKDINGNFDFRVCRSSVGGHNSSKPVRITEDGKFIMFPISEDKINDFSTLTD